jgi:hypothetical protein
MLRISSALHTIEENGAASAMPPVFTAAPQRSNMKPAHTIGKIERGLTALYKIRFGSKADVCTDVGRDPLSAL